MFDYNKNVEEYSIIRSKLKELEEFLSNPDKFNSIEDPLQKDLLVLQYNTLESYISVLSIRIGFMHE